MAEPNYRDVAQQIVNIVGKDNIVSATHCATRLRLIVKDKDAIDGKALEKVPLVKGTFFNAGQYQIILGTGIVNKVFGEMSAIGLSTLSKAEQDAAVKAQQKGIKRLMRTLGDIFVPIIPIIAATGLFLGLKGCLFNDNVRALFGVTTAIIPEYIATLVNVLTETAFAFLPAIICWSAYKVFGGMPVIGLVLGLMLVSPILPNAYSVATPDNGIEAIMAFGAIPLVGCQGSVLTAILTALIGATLEKKLRKVMPNALDLIMTPFVVMLVTFLVVILGIGPIMHVVELKLVAIVEFLVTIPFGIGGFIIGATYPLLVITGLHHTYTMIETSLLANTGFNPVITLCAMYGFANVGTCLAFFVKSKKESIRQTSIGAMLSQLFGISEPVLFGIQLRFNLRPLIMMLLTSGTGAALLSILGVQSNSYGLAVLPSYLMYIYEWRQLLWYFVISVFSVVMCFVLTSLFAIPKEILEPDEAEELPAPQAETTATTGVDCQPGTVYAPVSGTVIPSEKIPDETFATGVLGRGVGIEPAEGIVVAPFDGEISSVTDTHHAVGISSPDGMEVLIHVGVDTVAMQGDGFQCFVSEGQKVRAGDKLIAFDRAKIAAAKHPDVVVVLVTNSDDYEKLDIQAGDCKALDQVIAVH